MSIPVEKDFKKKFTETPEQITPEEFAEIKKRMDEETDKMEADLRFMRIRKEYYELSALLGMINVKNVPGLLGWELQKRFIESVGYVSQYEMGQLAAKKEAEEKETEAAGTTTKKDNKKEGKKSPIITDGQMA